MPNAAASRGLSRQAAEEAGVAPVRGLSRQAPSEAPAPGSDAKGGPPWQVWGFLGLAMVLNLAIGSASSYSYWKVGFYKHFAHCGAEKEPGGLRSADDPWGGHCWNHSSLSSLYSWCIFGGFICITPGIIFDKFGPRATAAYGLLLVNIGIGGLLVLLQLGGTPPVELVGFFYLLEEQGGAASLYMVAVCVLVRAFPSSLVGMASGGVAIAFGLSGLMWTALAGRVFGFVQGADPASTDLMGFLTLVMAATNVSGIAIFCAAPRILDLVDGTTDPELHSSLVENLEARGAGPPPIRKSIFSLDCMCLMALYSVVSAQVIGISSYLSSIPTAFSEGLSVEIFSTLPFISNVVGRVVYALVVDSLARCGGRPAITAGSVWINLMYIACFGVLAAAASSGGAPGWLICLMIFVGYSAYGGSVCFASSFTKLSFYEGHVGILIGLLFTVAAVASTVFSMFFGVGNSLNSSGIQRVPADFFQTWLAALASALCALPVTLLVAARALCWKSKSVGEDASGTYAQVSPVAR